MSKNALPDAWAHYTIVRDVSTSKPLNLSLKTCMTLAPSTSATVTASPLAKVKALVTPFNVNVIGKVAVVPVGIAFKKKGATFLSHLTFSVIETTHYGIKLQRTISLIAIT